MGFFNSSMLKHAGIGAGVGALGGAVNVAGMSLSMGENVSYAGGTIFGAAAGGLFGSVFKPNYAKSLGGLGGTKSNVPGLVNLAGLTSSISAGAYLGSTRLASNQPINRR